MVITTHLLFFILLTVADDLTFLFTYNFTFDFQCYNKDGIKITLDVTYQYKVRSANLKKIILDFRNQTGYLKVLEYAGMSSFFSFKRGKIPKDSQTLSEPSLKIENKVANSTFF